MGNVNNSTTDKPTSIERSNQLVIAYIKHINENIFEDEYIIPKTIINLCLNYYYPLTVMIWMNHIPDSSDIDPIYITDINDKHKYWKCLLHDVDNNNNDETESRESTESWWNMYCNAVCFAKNVNHCLPNHIKDCIIEYYNTHNNNIYSCYYSINRLLSSNPYNIIFKSGGLVHNQHATDNCNAIIFNSIEFQKPTKTEIIGFNWKLPNLSLQVYGNNFIYSDVYGLLSIGGIVDGLYLSGFYNLSFDNVSVINNNDWKWTALPSMNFNRYLPSATMINYDKLIVVGGYNGKHKFLGFVEIFDFGDKKWKLLNSISYERNQNGIYYDNKTNKVYIGGGRCDLFCVRKEIEYLDLYTNKWLNDIPNTNYYHNIYPQIWKDDNNQNILCIASVYNNCMEYIDLRLHNKSWNLLYGNKTETAIPMSLSTKFGIPDNMNFSEYCKLCI